MSISSQFPVALFLLLAAIPCARAEEKKTPTQTAGRLPGDLGTTKKKPRLPDIVIKKGKGLYVGYSRTGPFVRSDSWFPLHLYITNNSKRQFDGTIECAIKDPREDNLYMMRFNAPIMVPGHKATKHIVTYFYAPDRNMEISAHALNLDIRSSTHSAGLYSRYTLAIVPKKRLMSGKREDLILILADAKPVLPELVRLKKKPFIHKRFPVELKLDSLSTRWLGYSGVTTILWDGLDMAKVDRSLTQAIFDYVAAGGHLVLAIGNQKNRALSWIDRSILPCGIHETRMVDLGRLFFESLDKADAACAQLTPFPGSRVILADNNGRPLVVRKDVGGGMVTVIGFSLNEQFLQALSFTPSRIKTKNSDEQKWIAASGSFIRPTCIPIASMTSQRLRRHAVEYLTDSATRKIPSRASIAAFLVIYLLVLVPLCYMIFRGLKRIEFAWLAMAAASIIFYLFSYFVAFGDLETALSVTDLSVMRLGPDGKGAVATFSLLYNPKYAEYDITYEQPEITPMHIRSDVLPGLPGEKTHTHIYHDDGRRHRLLGFEIDFNAKRPLESFGPVDFGSKFRLRLDSSFPGQRGDTIGEADNELGYLSSSLLLWGKAACILGPVAPGRKVPIRRSTEQYELMAAIKFFCAKQGRPGMHNFLKEAILSMAGGEDRCIFVTFLKRSPADWNVNNKPVKTNALTVILVAGDEVVSQSIPEYFTPNRDPDYYPEDDTYYGL